MTPVDADVLKLGKLAPKRALFLQKALEYMGSPYRWNGKGETVTDGEGRPFRVFDCSGLVTCALHEAGGPDFRAQWNTDALLDELEPTDAPAPGDLCLYGAQGDASHVMAWLAGGLVFGASGGGKTTTTLDAARSANAKVKVKTSHTYRPDFLGFRSLSEYLD